MSTLEYPGAELVPTTYETEYLHPGTSEGVFLPEELQRLQFDTTIKRIIPKEFEETDKWGNRLSRWRVEMNDGTKLGLNYLEPRYRATDTAILETPAWFTNLHGFNEHTQRILGSLGFPSLLVGHVGQERDSAFREAARTMFRPWQVVRELRQISLARQAHNMLEILKHGSFDLNPDAAFTHGNSRGGMVQFPLIAMADQQGIFIPFAMPVAPCFHRGFDKERLLHHGKQLPNEAANIGRILVNNMFDMAGSGLNTVNLSPKAMLYEAAHGPALFSGETGTYDDFIPQAQNMLILSYEGDVAGQKEEFEEAFSGFPNVYVRGVPGAHLSIADKRTRSYVTYIFGEIAKQTRDGVALDDLNFDHVKSSLHLVPDANE
jgi:hypothetical protein